MKSNIEWKQWGKSDPLFAVSTWPGREKGGTNPWTDEDFYAMGQSDWSDFYKQWKQYGCDARHCIEIGCGAGRLTKFIATAFKLVSAIDVSQDQLQYAKERVGHENVTYYLTDGQQLSSVETPATAIFSAHVFQHFDGFADTEHLMREVYQRLAPGGSIMIHLPNYNLPDSYITALINKLILFTKQVGNIKAFFSRRHNRLIMRGLTVERSQLVACLESLGFQGIEFRTFRVRSNWSMHDFVFALKPALTLAN